MDEHAYLESSEWQYLAEPWELTPDPSSRGLPAGAETITVWRDESYRLRGSLTGKVTPSGPTAPGAVLGGFSVALTYLQSCYIYYT